jgi:hypothetical protein
MMQKHRTPQLLPHPQGQKHPTQDQKPSNIRYSRVRKVVVLWAFRSPQIIRALQEFTELADGVKGCEFQFKGFCTKKKEEVRNLGCDFEFTGFCTKKKEEVRVVNSS